MRNKVALALGLLLVCTVGAQAAQQTLFLSLQDNKHQRRVEALQNMLKRHGGDIQASKINDAPEGEKGLRFNCVLIVPDKVAESLKRGMDAQPIEAVTAQVTFKSKAGLFSKTINQFGVDCPETGFEATFSWYKNEFARDPWGFFKKNFPGEFAQHTKQVDKGGKAQLRIKKPVVKVELFPKGFQADARSIFFELEQKSGDLYFDVEGGE